MNPRTVSLLAALIGIGLASCAPKVTTTPTRPVTIVTSDTPAPAPATTTVITTTNPATPVTPAAPAQTYIKLAPLSTAPVTRFSKAEQVTQPGKLYRAVLNTSKGPITLDLNLAAAPYAVNNFVFLALNHFYDGTRFHRVIGGFMAQGGDPQSSDPALQPRWGTGGPGYNFMAENNNGLKFDSAGVLGMARSSALDSQGSQFFITLAPADFLNGQYTVFGKVVDGMDVLNSLTKTAGAGDQPIAGAVPDMLNSVDILVQ